VKWAGSLAPELALEKLDPIALQRKAQASQ